MRVKITDPALNRITEIANYYKQKGYSRRGKELKKELVRLSKLLIEHPYMGQEEEYLKHLNQGHRYLLVEPCYKIIYLIANPDIYIVDIFDTRQNPTKMKGG